MAYGPKQCACCGSTKGIEEHHLYLKSEDCPDNLTVWLCSKCHGLVHGLMHRPDLSETAKGIWRRPGFRERIIAVFRAKKAVRTRRKNAAARIA